MTLSVLDHKSGLTERSDGNADGDDPSSANVECIDGEDEEEAALAGWNEESSPT